MATEVLPPAPNAGQLGRFGGVGPSLFTGAAQQQIALFTIQTRDLKVPISLSYHSSGVKVDELASRTGLGWVLNFGGVINRTVYDVPDEFGTFKSPPTSFNNRVPTLYNYLKTAVQSDYTGQDTQPDVFNFNFNGISGKFILDSIKHPILIDESNLKIEPAFSGTTWNFKITDGNGTQYFFGGSQATENTKTYTAGGTTCGKTYGSPIPTAWYLNKIKSAKGDSIVFKYTPINYFYSSAVSESLTRTPNTGAGASCPGTQTTCETLSNDIVCGLSLSTQGVALAEVDFDQGKVTIDNISRADVNGDVLISNINVYKSASTTVLKQFSLAYIYSNSGTNYVSNRYIGGSEKVRPFLQSVVEKDAGSVAAQKYLFSYDDINGLPPRLSFAQDHYGYFNGKNNTIFVPPADDPYIQGMFPAFMGDRSPDSAYAKKGLLTKIVYPTGGSDSLVYEPHKGLVTVAIPPPNKNVSQTVTGAGIRSAVTASTTSSVILKKAGGVFTLYCEGLGGSGTYDTLHQFAEAEVDDAATGSRLLYLKALPFETKTGNVELDPGQTYTIKVTAYGSVIAGNARLTYADGDVTYEQQLGQFGGMRIAKVITLDPAQNNTAIKRFYYAPLSNLSAHSSNTVIDAASILYYKDYKSITNCETFCTYKQGSSSSLYNLFVYDGDNVVYDSVIEGFGNNFENGGIEHLFTVRADIPAHIAMGNDVKGAPLSNIGWDNGHETNTNYFKRNGAGYLYSRKIYNHFVNDSRAKETHYGYVITNEYTIEHNPIASTDYDQFDVLQYNINSNWVYKDSTRTTEYDAQQNIISSHLEVNRYDNPKHFNLTRSQITKSNGQLLTTLTTYPQDYTTSTTFINNLVTNHVLDVPVETVSYRQNADGINTNIISGVLRTYKPDGKGLVDSVYGIKTVNLIPLVSFKFSNAGFGVLPITGTAGAYAKSASYELRLNSISYDGFGNLTEQRVENGPFISYRWGYNSTYPIAKAANAEPNEFYYEGFEESTASGVTTGTGHTGVKYTTNPLVTWTKPNTRSFVISYWYRSGTGAWQFRKEQTYVGPNFTMSGGDSFDDIRICPADAQINSFTFDPMLGVTSSTDGKSETTYYEYDSFQRLMNVKDKDGNIVKHTDYHYSGQ
ncbi:hypothetical protein FHW88_000450 [Mucilaginibacter sp. SG538B]|uniref:hypothetical protein n=1 Tax=Mucilaginibacter sp. SG538B TaxID=2587021 RepID=UPI00159E9094|nr:hypothetical protein [Mucilaginibacter sp. SG538B]NVM62174.1 hypothetical protein [Mucilaginibacter sp. SG538B]